MQRFIIALTMTIGFVAPAYSNEQIAFTQCLSYFDGDGNEIVRCHIALTDPSGATTVNLTDGANPSWSPDGTQIAFEGTGRAGESFAGAISVIDLQTGSISTLTNTGLDYAPSWSPDGSKIAFISDRGTGYNVFVMSAGGTQQVTFDGNAYWFRPAWLSDQSLAYDCTSATTFNVCSVNIDGTGQRTLAVDGGQPAYSPVTQRILFSAGWSGGLHLASMNADGSDIQPIPGASPGFAPAWSPDGTHIVFDEPPGACDQTGYCNDYLFVANADGSGWQWIGGGQGARWTNTPLDHFVAPPVAQFFGWCDQATCTFDGQSSWDNDSTPSIAWDFGDGTSGTGGFVTHEYAIHGTVMVTLTATDAGGLTSTQTQQFIVGNHPPTASFTFSCSGRTCTFDGSASSDADGSIASYEWNFGDGAVAGGATATHTYTRADAYPVYLTVYDAEGAGAYAQQYVTIVNVPPSAAFTFSCAAATCTFDGSASSDSDGTISSYLWNFGDGSTATGKTVAHTYTGSGAYNVTLSVMDNEYATASLTRAVTVARPLMHSGDLDASAARTPPSWSATVTVTIHTASHAPLSNANVAASWSTGATASCITNTAGQCAMSLSAIPAKLSSVTLTLTNVSHAQYDYQAAANHDPDGDSNGTMVTVRKP